MRCSIIIRARARANNSQFKTLILHLRIFGFAHMNHTFYWRSKSVQVQNVIIELLLTQKNKLSSHTAINKYNNNQTLIFFIFAQAHTKYLSASTAIVPNSFLEQLIY